MSDTDTLRIDSLAALAGAFSLLERRLPTPSLVRTQKGLLLRYRERLPGQVALLKLARVISGLHALETLRSLGLFQEQCVIQRTLEEFDEDIAFVAYIFTDKREPIHDRYFTEFWDDHLPPDDPLSMVTDGPSIPRSKIRACLIRALGVRNTHHASRLGAVLHKTYSGFVHASYAQVMEMYDAQYQRFRVSGWRQSPFADDHDDDSLNYHYRGIMSAMQVASILQDEGAFDQLAAFKAHFEQQVGIENLIEEPPP